MDSIPVKPFLLKSRLLKQDSCDQLRGKVPVLPREQLGLEIHRAEELPKHRRFSVCRVLYAGWEVLTLNLIL